MRFDMDLTKVKSLSPIPDGVYLADIKGYDIKKSQTGNDMITWKLELLQPAEVAEKTPIFYTITSLHPDALFHLKGLYEACNKLEEGGFDPEDLIGCSIGFVTLLELTKQWGLRNRVTKWLKADRTNAVQNKSFEDVEKMQAEADGMSGTAEVTSDTSVLTG